MTREEILNEINTEQLNHSELNALDATSKVSIWYFIKWLFSELFLVVIQYLEMHKLEVESIIAAAPYSTINWYIERAKEFQLNDSLTNVNEKFVYPTIDEDKQIIKQIAVIHLNRELIFKIAKEESEALTACTEDEQTKFKAYIEQIKYPGTVIRIESFLADKLILAYRLEYNAMLNLSDVKLAVEKSLTNYVKNITFNGKYNTTAATDELQKLSETTNAFATGASGRTNLQDEALATSFTQYYESTAGYMEIDKFIIEYIPV